MNASYVEFSGLRVAACLADLVNDSIAPGTGVSAEHFWAEFAALVDEFRPQNARLLQQRNDLQASIDKWLIEAREADKISLSDQKRFLREIGYLAPDPGPVEITTANVDPEIAHIAGPQLVVPIDNARYVLNAANARWNSLYDALYGTDVIPEDPGFEKGKHYNPARGKLVVGKAAAVLDEAAPLATGSHAQSTSYAVSDGELRITLADGLQTTLASNTQFAGTTRKDNRLTGILLRNNGLHLEIQIDPSSQIGQAHPAGVKDVLVESALSVIADCEDSVAAVDAEDKTQVYANWLGLMRGTLQTKVRKNGREIVRKLAADRSYESPTGEPFTLPGRAVLLARNVGAHLNTDAVTTSDGAPVPETFLDAMICALAAKHDLSSNRSQRNSRTGSIYFVKPKQHGPEEVALAIALFTRIERALSLPPRTIKIGIMDEERRTTVNLKACLKIASERVIFINTGFLDRTGDEIHTMMELGPTMPKNDMKTAKWMLAYEDWNVDIGLAAGMRGHGQIGKGMWAIPDEMAQMLATKMAHPMAGANTAWVPSPTAATLHALHYHQVDVHARQKLLAERECASLDDILTMPLHAGPDLSSDAIQTELDNNAQGILGYVVRWVEQGVGCSKVPDINHVGLMEDRATLRISSQHIANWLYHGLISEPQVIATFERMASIVDQQNIDDPAYRNMAPAFDKSIAFQASLELVMSGRSEPNGYTEPVLHRRRREFKQKIGSV